MRALLAPLLLVVILSASADAGHCTTWTTTEPDLACGLVDLPGGDQPYYADESCCAHGCIYSLWIYEESNGIPGLQRGDELADDTCHGMVPSDTIVL